jgi:hypothetical protein
VPARPVDLDMIRTDLAGVVNRALEPTHVASGPPGRRGLQVRVRSWRPSRLACVPSAIASGLKDEIADHPVYSDWVAFYLQQEEADLVMNMRETFDDMTRDGAVSDDKRRQLAEIFMMSSRLEGMFWDMAYTLDQWPDLG